MLCGTPGTASAQPPPNPGSIEGTVVRGDSARGVSQDYLVLPDGAELTGSMRFLTSDPLFVDGESPKPLAFSDMALFGLTFRKSLFSKLELTANVELLPKQPAYTSEKAWQSVAFGLKSPIGNTVAVGLSGSGGHLLGSDGSWIRQSLSVEIRKPIHEVLTFDVRGGIDSTLLRRDDHDGGWLTEFGVSGQALFRDPHGYVGGWVGMGYSIPVTTHGYDPTTDVMLGP